MPILDSIESELSRDADGNEVTNWFMLKCPQFKHLNLCLNKIDEEAAPTIEDVLLRTPDDFGFTLSGNAIEGAPIIKIHNSVTNLHKTRVQEARQADASAIVVEIDDIAQRRAAF